ncbi:gamma-glutamyltransferase family protein [Photobacterium sp. DNB22_13_2]
MNQQSVSFTAPHYKAAEAGQAVLEAGGTACEAMVAAAAAVAVYYPHMNGLGGDSFWLIAKANQAPIAIDGCGRSAMNIDNEYCQQVAQNGLPTFGAGSTLTMAGTVSGWQKALEYDSSGKSLLDLFQVAIAGAEAGVLVTESLAAASRKTFESHKDNPGFAATFLPQAKPLEQGDSVTNPALANTLRRLADAGLDDFYQGQLAELMAVDLAQAGSVLSLDDFLQHQAEYVQPLSVNISKGCLYNMDAPTQGVASLLILAIYDLLFESATSEVDHMHLLVEATKQAFRIRNREVTDPNWQSGPLADHLKADQITQLASDISLEVAAPWPEQAVPGDTVWMGAVDQYGTMVSFIQSVYWEFGSGVLLPQTGIVWNNRGISFNTQSSHHNALAPRKKPFHTLNPAYAELKDGSRMIYGTMGGEGQPQTQACLFSRYHYQGESLAESIAKPRWLLGRTWGDDNHHLRLEQSLFQNVSTELAAKGHQLACVDNLSELMGHAGAIVRQPDGKIEAATDPRSDGQFFIRK